MIEVNTIEDAFNLVQNHEIDLDAEAAERIVERVLELIEQTIWTASVLHIMGQISSDNYKVLRGFILDLFDVILQELGVDASKLLNSLNGDKPSSVGDLLYGGVR